MLLSSSASSRIYDESLRVLLIARSADAIAAGGVAGLSLREVATAAATSTNAVYTLFGGKDGLVEAVVEEASGSFAGAQRAVPSTPDAMGDLIALGNAYRAWVLANPALYAVLMGGRVPGTGLTGAGWTTDPSCQPLLDAVRRAVRDGCLVADDVEQVAVTLWAGVHGMVTLESALWSDLPIAERDERFAIHLMALACGWLAQPAPPG